MICSQFAYLVFLALFSYVILIRQDKIPSISEKVLIIFVCTLCTEEIRQVFKPRFNLTFKLNQNSDSCAYVFYGWQLGIYYLSCVNFLHKRELRKFQVSVVQWWLRKEPNGLTCYADFVFLLIKPIAFFGVLFVNSLSSSMPNAPYYWTKRIIRYAWNCKELKQRLFWATHVNRKWGIFSLKCFRATKFKSCVWLFTYRGRTGVWRCIESHVLWKQVNLKRSSGNLRLTDDDVRLFS